MLNTPGVKALKGQTHSLVKGVTQWKASNQMEGALLPHRSWSNHRTHQDRRLFMPEVYLAAKGD